MQLLRALWAYRHFIDASIRSELKRRFARSRLGALWFILHPLAQAAIFAVVLSEVLAAKLAERISYLFSLRICAQIEDEPLLIRPPVERPKLKQASGVVLDA